MARRKGSLWHDPLAVVGAEENNGDVVDGRNSALRGGPVGREHLGINPPKVGLLSTKTMPKYFLNNSKITLKKVLK